MNKHFLLLAAPLVFSAGLGAFAAPRAAKPAKAAPVHTGTPAPSITPGPFRDVPPDHWAARAVETLRQAGIVRGYPGTVSQAQAAREERAP